MKYKNIREEELKNKVGVDWFKNFDSTEIIGNIDFSVFPKQNSLFGRTPLLWAEVKTGDFEIATMFVQLILTIGKARTFDKTMPPAFLGAFDFKKFAFLHYISIQDIFYMNDFNWNVAPSNHASKEFKLIKKRVEETLATRTYVFDFEKDEKELHAFIKNNIAKASTSKIKIDKNNFIPIYLRWLELVKPIIDVDWEELKKNNIFDSDFYLADLFVDDRDTHSIDDDITTRDSLFVIYENSGYKIEKGNLKTMFDATINIKRVETYQQFWKSYKRPPIKEFQNYIIERRDLLVPQDIRERKGAFFTPRQWVELSQSYIADVLGENWQDEYYVWDCAAGTGNLLAGLTNKYNIWASTLDQADVNVMHERIDHGASLLKSHVFQFDFLNDDFSKLPESLQDIINDEEKRKKLVIYINPPYAEVSSKAEKGKVGVNITETHKKYSNVLGTAGRELYAQFMVRIYSEIPGCILAEFSKLKILQGAAFIQFKNYFLAKLEKMFIAPANTFDNVRGQFPIGFKIWDTNKNEIFTKTLTDIYDKNGIYIGTKGIYSVSSDEFINRWISLYKTDESDAIGFMDGINGNDFQHNNIVYILNSKEQLPNPRGIWINKNNLIAIAVYLTVRKCLPTNWLNDRDQFLVPNNRWINDLEFQNDSLAYSLFHYGNNMKSEFDTNHWIPFTEAEVDAQEKFESSFMSDFIQGKLKAERENGDTLFGESEAQSLYDSTPRQFSSEAEAVFDAGRELWRYYHKQEGVNVNASYYDIREYFQGRNEKGRMNPRSDDEIYTELLAELRYKMDLLADKIIPKIYEYEFLKE